MTSSVVLLDPTHEQTPAVLARQPRPASLKNLTVGLLDISKPRGDLFLDELERLLTAAGATIKRYTKPTYTRPAPLDMQQVLAAECDVVIEGLAD